MSYVPRLKQEYKERIVNSLKEEFGYKSVMQVPKLEKIVLSRGVGQAVADKKLIEHAVDELTAITGQRAVSTLSKKDVASFKLRKGMPIGAKVTLRGERMYEFLDRLINIALPEHADPVQYVWLEAFVSILLCQVGLFARCVHIGRCVLECFPSPCLP